MDAVITRIIEIEKQCAMEIKQAEDLCREKIEAHKRDLKEKKGGEYARIMAAGDARATQAIEALKKQTESAFLAAGRDDESRFQDPALTKTIKEKILVILLTE
jgi:hypothetical protein